MSSTEQFGEVIDRIAAHVLEHRTTLVFVNTRRMSERLAHLLGERLGPDQVAAHHGSLSKDRRLRVEDRLRAGDLRALVATASLELGIDIGPVELVCQVGSPRAIATFLQRVGRSNHSPRRHARRDPLSHDARRAGGVRRPAGGGARRPARRHRVRRWPRSTSSPSRSSPRWRRPRSGPRTGSTSWCGGRPVRGAGHGPTSTPCVELVSEGITTGRGKRMAYVHRDGVNGVLRPRRGARLAALTSGGAIPEVGDYRVVADPDDTRWAR